MEDTFLMFVDIKNGVQSNKFYNMFPQGDDSFRVEYGRVDSTKTTMTYPMSKWKSVYNSKTKKGYTDITHLKGTHTVVSEDSGNKTFDEFYNIFRKYTGDIVKRTFLSEGCSKGQLEEAQNILNKIVQLDKVDTINKNLLELYKVIPRRMSDVRAHLISNPQQLQSIVVREQDALDSMDSSNIMNVSNPYKELGIEFSEASAEEFKMMGELINPTNNSRHKIYKIFKIKNIATEEKFSSFVEKTKNKECQYLIHGTRNPNIFSIMKGGLLIRPTNAAVISGAAYGNGIYHSAHTAKSLNYTGHDSDKIFFIQNVNMGKPYEYSGWYRDGKDLSRDKMNYEALNKMGYDSLYVKPGDGLLNSEYIVYKSEQTTTNFLIWMK